MVVYHVQKVTVGRVDVGVGGVVVGSTCGDGADTQRNANPKEPPQQEQQQAQQGACEIGRVSYIRGDDLRDTGERNNEAGSIVNSSTSRCSRCPPMTPTTKTYISPRTQAPCRTPPTTRPRTGKIQTLKSCTAGRFLGGEIAMCRRAALLVLRVSPCHTW